MLERLATVDWGIFHGGSNHEVRGKMLDDVSGLQAAEPDAPIMLAHFVAFRGPVVKMMRDYLRAILTRPPGDPAGGSMDVDGAYCHFRADHPEVLTVIANPPIAIQRPSFADVRERKWSDRVRLFAPFLQIARKIKREVRRRA